MVRPASPVILDSPGTVRDVSTDAQVLKYGTTTWEDALALMVNFGMVSTASPATTLKSGTTTVENVFVD